jgi:hypothetical protein
MPQPQTEPSLLGKLLAFIIGAILLVLGFMFSVVILAVVAVLGLATFGYFWWKTRALRQALRDRPPMPPHANGEVIDGEAIVVEEYPRHHRPGLPDEPTHQ